MSMESIPIALPNGQKQDILFPHGATTLLIPIFGRRGFYLIEARRFTVKETGIRNIWPITVKPGVDDAFCVQGVRSALAEADFHVTKEVRNCETLPRMKANLRVKYTLSKRFRDIITFKKQADMKAYLKRHQLSGCISVYVMHESLAGDTLIGCGHTHETTWLVDELREEWFDRFNEWGIRFP